MINQEFSRYLETIKENDQTKELTEVFQLIIQYIGKQDHEIISKKKKDLSKILLTKVKTMVTYQ